MFSKCTWFKESNFRFRNIFKVRYIIVNIFKAKYCRVITFRESDKRRVTTTRNKNYPLLFDLLKVNFLAQANFLTENFAQRNWLKMP